MNKLMNVLFWVPYPREGASNRYRVEQYLPYLKLNKIEYSLHPFWSTAAFRLLYKRGHYIKKIYYFILGTIFRLSDLLQIFRYDIVFIHREAYPVGGDFFESLLVFFKKPIIFDFDYSIFFLSSSRSNSFIERFKSTKRVFRIINKSSHVIVGNRYLADFASRYNKSVSIIPTPIDTDKYYLKNHKHADKITIGWIGSVTTVDFLRSMREVFIQLAHKYNNLRFKTIGGSFSVNGIEKLFQSTPWLLEGEIEGLRSFDIGIMPMPDNKWTRGKCGFKAILYMSMGIPCVCSPVGMNKEIITDGIDGFLAYSEDEWIKKLSLLIESITLRKRIGLAGRKTVEEKYSLKVNTPRFLEILKSIYERR